MSRLGALGTVVWDRIHPPPEEESTGEVHEDWGGLFYSLAALGAWSAASSTPRVTVAAIKVGADLYESALARISRLPGEIETGGVLPVPEANNRVDLYYHDRGDRCERLEGGVPGWSWDELAPIVESCDALYVNFIAGWELRLEDAESLRSGFEGPIYVDIHSLLLGVGDGGMRVRRPLPEWRRWTACFDWVQGNAEELRVMTGCEDPLEAAAEIAGSGPRAAFATRGRHGAAWVSDSGDRGEVPPVEPSSHEAEIVDPTGCGDVWGAACVSALLDGAGPGEAAERAGRFAAVAARHRGTAGLDARLAAVAGDRVVP